MGLDSTNYTNEQLLEFRKEYFKNYFVEDDEVLTNEFELKCTKCNSNRYFQIGNFVRKCLCACQHKKIIEQEEESAKQRHLQAFEKLKAASLLGEKYKKISFDTLDLDRPSDFLNAVERCKTFCKKWDEVKKQGLGMYIYGDVGTGKTLLTACIGNYLLEQMTPVLFTNFFEIGKQIKNTYSGNGSEFEFIDKLSNIDLLIIDDIGTEVMERNGERTWIQDKIYDVVNARYINNKVTIFTSNESLSELVQNGLMRKTVDRIAAMSAAKIKLTGTSYRLNEQSKNTIF